jgi:WD40 repeat protein
MIVSRRRLWAILVAAVAVLCAFGFGGLIRHLRPVASFDVPFPDVERLDLSFSRSGKIIAISVTYGPVFFYDVASGKPLSSWEWRRHLGYYTPFAAGGEWLVMTTSQVGDEYQILQINPLDGTESVVFRRPWSEFTLEMTEFTKELAIRTPVGLSPDGGTWYHARPGIGIEVWDISEGARRHTLEFEGVTNVTLSPNGKILAAFNEQGDVRVWQVESGTEKARFSGLSLFRYSKLDVDDAGVVLLDDSRQFDAGTHASRALLGPDSEKIVKIADRRVLQRFPNGDVLLAHEPFQQDIYPSFSVDRHTPPLPPGTLLLEDRLGKTRWRRDVDAREIDPIALTPFQLLLKSGENRVAVIDLRNGSEIWHQTLSPNFDGYSRDSFALSPDGRFVAYGYAHHPRNISRVTIWRL